MTEDNHMRLGIYAPYNRSETSAMAMRLACAARRIGWSVNWLATTVGGQVNPYWDKVVRVATDARAHEWGGSTDTRVWFASDLGRFCVARKAASRPADVLVPAWHAMTAYDAGWLHRFDSVVCPNRAMQVAIARLVPDGRQVLTCVWPSGVARQLRCGLRHPDGVPRAVMVADAYTGRHHGRGVIDAADLLLKSMPELRLTVAIDHAPDRTEHRRLCDLMVTRADRVTVAVRPNPSATMAAVCDADWLIDASVRHDSGLLISQAQAMGVPAIAWRVSPVLGGIVRDNDGWLVECGKTFSITGAEQAQWCTRSLVAGCVQAISNTSRLVGRQAACFQRSGYDHDDVFAEFWRTAFELQTA